MKETKETISVFIPDNDEENFKSIDYKWGNRTIHIWIVDEPDSKYCSLGYYDDNLGKDISVDIKTHNSNILARLNDGRERLSFRTMERWNSLEDIFRGLRTLKKIL